LLLKFSAQRAHRPGWRTSGDGERAARKQAWRASTLNACSEAHMLGDSPSSPPPPAAPAPASAAGGVCELSQGCSSASAAVIRWPASFCPRGEKQKHTNSKRAGTKDALRKKEIHFLAWREGGGGAKPTSHGYHTQTHNAPEGVLLLLQTAATRIAPTRRSFGVPGIALPSCINDPLHTTPLPNHTTPHTSITWSKRDTKSNACGDRLAHPAPLNRGLPIMMLVRADSWDTPGCGRGPVSTIHASTPSIHMSPASVQTPPLLTSGGMYHPVF